MKKHIKYLSIGFASVLALGSCSDEFLQEKKNYDNVTQDVYNYIEGANGRLNDIYAWSLPQSENVNWQYPSCGNADEAGKCTEEYSGFGPFVDPVNELSSMSSGVSVPDYFQGGNNNIQAMVYGRIRNINDFITNMQSSTLDDKDKNLMLGQAYFLRAWCYYLLVKWYGGVPIVTEVLDPVESSFTPRSSAKDCIEFIINELNTSAELLDGKIWTSEDYGRVTSGTALALKGRVLLMWCSPLFNRDDDESRWTSAYAEMKADLETINACGYGLYNNANDINGSAFALQFLQAGQNPEAVFVSLFNNHRHVGLGDDRRTNMWENGVRPKNTCGSGKGASAMLVDMFPMADGKIPAGTGTYTKLEDALETSTIQYDASYPFMNRDPRFYRTFAMPGFRWSYNGDASEADASNPSDGPNYELWNYVWYTSLDDQSNPEGTAYGADNLLDKRQYIYVRKKSDDLDVNGSPLYSYYPLDTKDGGPFYSGAQLIELRYAEVLLNLAEVACGAGSISDAVQYLQQVRDRAGVPAYNNLNDRATCMSAILYERQVEFAYEGKRFDDMRRWLLFDGGANFASIGAKTLTGWGGNTCTWLGFKQFNGQRRENMAFRTADKYGTGGKTAADNDDPLKKNNVARCPAVDLRQDLTSQLETLKAWYQENLVRQKKIGDGRDDITKAELYINFRPKYYFLGFKAGVSEKNKGLPQTIGWEDSNNGGAMGTFDPLTAE